MTQDLLKFKEDKLIFLDIETVAGNEELDENSEEFGIFSWKMRNKDTDEELPVEEVKALYKRKAALYPAHAKIVCITVGFILKNTIVLKTYRGEEEDLLRDFVDTMVLNKDMTFVIWNAPFDMPMIRKRFFINKLRNYLPDDMGNDSMKKPWTLKGILDLMDVWKGIGFYNESMAEVAWAMGLPSPKEDLNGSMVTKAYYDGEEDRVVAYNQVDVKTLINIYRVLTEKEPIDEVVIREESSATKVNVFEQILGLGAITDSAQKILTKKAKKLDESEKDNLVEIIKGLLGRKEKDLTEKENKFFETLKSA
jgi:3'-5' exonuclease